MKKLISAVLIICMMLPFCQMVFANYTVSKLSMMRIEYPTDVETQTLSEGRFYATAVVRNASTSPRKATIITALYENDILVKIVEATSSNIIPGGSVTFSTSNEPINLLGLTKSELENYKIKIFLLENTQTITPIYDIIEYDVNTSDPNATPSPIPTATPTSTPSPPPSPSPTPTPAPGTTPYYVVDGLSNWDMVAARSNMSTHTQTYNYGSFEYIYPNPGFRSVFAYSSTANTANAYLTYELYKSNDDPVKSVSARAFYWDNYGYAGCEGGDDSLTRMNKVLEAEGLKFYESATLNGYYTEIQDVTLHRTLSPFAGLTRHVVEHEATQFKSDTKFVRIVIPRSSDGIGSTHIEHVRINYADSVYSIKSRINVISPEYCSSINSEEQEIEICAPGVTNVTARAWNSNLDAFVNLGSVALDGDGFGSFIFPAKDFHRGPVVITISGNKSGNPSRDECNLQLYNYAGTEDYNGFANFQSPPAITGLGLTELFADDFSVLPGMTWDDRHSYLTYNTHTPGWVDFSGFVFADANNDPGRDARPGEFGDTYESVDGEYLRIRARQYRPLQTTHIDYTGGYYTRIDSDTGNVWYDAHPRGPEGSTGLITTIHQNRTGFAVKAPAYFECRFLAQYAKGTWPAFWLMTQPGNGVAPNSGSDELDIIEAYGFDSSTQTEFNNAWNKGYETSLHTWDQPYTYRSGNRDRVDANGEWRRWMDSASKRASMSVDTGGTWFTNFHTYGCLITEEYTIYYLDDVEYFRHPTTPKSKNDYLYFYINFAIGGISGWSWDLSRYNGYADMYVDFVRVYGLEANVMK